MILYRVRFAAFNSADLNIMMGPTRRTFPSAFFLVSVFQNSLWVGRWFGRTLQGDQVFRLYARGSIGRIRSRIVRLDRGMDEIWNVSIDEWDVLDDNTNLQGERKWWAVVRMGFMVRLSVNEFVRD